MLKSSCLIVEQLERIDSAFLIDSTTKDITELLLNIIHEIKCDLMSNDAKEQLTSNEGVLDITQSPANLDRTFSSRGG